MDWLTKWTKEKLEKEYTRRDLLKKIPVASAVVVGTAILGNEAIKYLEKRSEAQQLSTALPPVEAPVVSTPVDLRAENAKPGTDQWKITKPAGSRLQGFADKHSAVPGESVTFYVHSVKPYRIEIYRMGYYQGKGGRLVAKLGSFPEQKQNLKPLSYTMEADWEPSYSFKVPGDWPTGMYMAKLVDEDDKESYIPFVVRQKFPTATFAVLCGTNTYHAYNNWGGKSLYTYNSTNAKQTTAVSFNRPYKSNNGSGLFFQFEYNLIRWLEKEGYSLTYLTDIDLHHRVLEHSNVKALIIAGHSEYWSMEMRQSVEALTASRINLAVFSANCAYWQVRMNPDPKGRADRVMLSYKQFAAQKDPYRTAAPALVTGRWRDEPVNMPEDRMFGSMYIGIPHAPAPLVVSNDKHWIYEGTGLKNGDMIPGVVGGEVDAYLGKLPGVEVLTRSPVNIDGQTKEANVIWYNKPTGGKVFAVGSFFWNRFLDPIHFEKSAHADKAIQTMTKNALRELMK